MFILTGAGWEFSGKLLLLENTGSSHPEVRDTRAGCERPKVVSSELWAGARLQLEEVLSLSRLSYR